MAGRLYVVGMGPGSYEQMTIQAARVLEQAQVLAGYTAYVERAARYFPGKEVLAAPMRQEVSRCRQAFARAAEGAVTALVCGGDAGIYGMAGLVLELAPEYPDVQVEIIPGVTAASAGGALLGAPIGHDFAVISLSDLLTPLEVIDRRLACAAAADLAICLYNPGSRRRKGYLKRACRIVGRWRSPDTVCGLVRQIGREGQQTRILTLARLAEEEPDMATTVFIGSSAARAVNGRMILPRGYRLGEADAPERDVPEKDAPERETP